MYVKTTEELIYEIKEKQLAEMDNKSVINEGLFFYAVNHHGVEEQVHFWRDNDVSELPAIEDKFKYNNNIKTVYVSNEYKEWTVEYMNK